MMRVFRCSFTLYLVLVTSAFGCDLEVSDPWIREAPPTATAMAGYMVLANRGNDDCVLIGVRATGFSNAMLHRTEHQGDTAHMMHQDTVRIPADGRVVFEPNGLHIMLMHPDQPLKNGDRVTVTLVLETGDAQQLEFPVRQAPPR